jgi:hypothetical protein
MYIDRVDDRVIEVRDPHFSFTELEEAKQIVLERLKENPSVDASTVKDVVIHES